LVTDDSVIGCEIPGVWIQCQYHHNCRQLCAVSNVLWRLCAGRLRSGRFPTPGNLTPHI